MVGHTVQQQQVHLQHLLPDPGQSAVREWRSVECNEVKEDGGGGSRGLTAPANWERPPSFSAGLVVQSTPDESH